MHRKRKIAMVGCFDTKAEVFAFLYQQLVAQQCEVIAINTGLLGSTDAFPVQYEREDLLASVGSSVEAVKQNGDRNEGVQLMAKAAQQCLQACWSRGEIEAVIGMGGGGGSYIVLTAMQGIPFGVPKICISTLATKDVSHLVRSSDIVLVPSIVDVAGLNSIISVLIQQSASAIVAMVQTQQTSVVSNQKRIAISMFGNTTACVETCTTLLQDKGYEVFAFHANGSGGRAMEELIENGYFEAVLDITTTELADELCGGICSAGPTRLTAAARANVIQVVVPGCLDMVNFGAMASVPAQFQERNLFAWSPDVTLLRTNEVENEYLGKVLVRKLLASKVGVTIVLPTKGISKIDQEGSSFHDPKANQVLFDTIEKEAGDLVPVIRTPYHINERSFAECVTNELLKLLDTI